MIRNYRAKSANIALFVFLFKLRIRNSDYMITSILQLRDEPVFSDYINSIIKSFDNDVLSLRFGIHSVFRHDLLQKHITEMAKKLFNLNQNLFLIRDITYAPHQKITKNEYQRKYYSVRMRYLFENLSLCARLKVMLLTCLDHIMLAKMMRKF